MPNGEDKPVVAVGDRIKVNWPLEDGTSEWVSGDVVEVLMSSKVKHGSRYKYKILLKNESSPSETRLINLEWKLKSSSKKRKTEDDQPSSKKAKQVNGDLFKDPKLKHLPPTVFNHIVAPMVGASELAFRLLCRRYGATIAYTPMMNSEKFAVDAEYRKEEFQTTPEDRPLVAHFSANDPQVFLAAAKHVENQCDAIDLNLGCPQRVAHSGHFGSFLLDDVDRPLVLSMVKTLSSNLKIPIFVKIRLLNTVDETIKLCQQLKDAGASLIAIHGRHRVSLVERSGPSAREGPALLDQIKAVREAITDIPIISNGNIREWNDVVNNRIFTVTNGVMSAEGLLDNPAIFNGGTPVNKLQLAMEYLELVDLHPVKMKSVIFHIRRMCRDELTQYQLLDEVLNAPNVDAIKKVIEQAKEYQSKGNYRFDPDKEKKQKEALERKKREEGRRKEYEARMMRKAKREGKPLNYYVELGAEAPQYEDVLKLKKLPQEESFALWKSKYGQHCYAFHFGAERCPKERTCAFLHCDSRHVEAEAESYG